MLKDETKTHFSHQLNSEETKLLCAVLGRVVLKLYSPYLEVCRLWYAAPHFSLPLGGGEFLIVESDWDQTPKESIDYHIMHVSVADHPRDIPRAYGPNGQKRIGSPVSSVEVGPPKSEVVSIAVLEYQEAGNEEAVQYDSGLVFTLADGRRFALVVRQSIAGGLECSTDLTCVEELLSESRIRRLLK